MESGDAPKRSPTAVELLDAGEAALSRGDSRLAFELLAEAAEGDIAEPHLMRLAAAYARAARYAGRHDQVLGWIEAQIADSTVTAPAQRAALLHARVVVCRQLDVTRALELVEEAIAASVALDDGDAVINLLSIGAFAAYRRGDARGARRFADRATQRSPTSRAGQYDAVRATMFAAVAAGELEAALELTIKARALAREQGRDADVANESNNLAEAYLELGYPLEARACADAGAKLARQVGAVAVELTAVVKGALASAEAGELDHAIAVLDELGGADGLGRALFWVDAGCARAYWLLERAAAGDARRALDVAATALELAVRAGVDSRLTALHAALARVHAREGREPQARAELEHARRAADRAEPSAQSLLALAAAEVLPATEPQRQIVLTCARARILRSAARREDPRAFCVNVRLNRRLLELSGGVPADLPCSG